MTANRLKHIQPRIAANVTARVVTLRKYRDREGIK